MVSTSGPGIDGLVVSTSGPGNDGLAVSTSGPGIDGPVVSTSVPRIEPVLQTVYVLFTEIHYDMQLWARALHTAAPRSTQPSTLHGTVNEYQPYG